MGYLHYAKSVFCLAASSVVLAGCAIKPVPGDYYPLRSSLDSSLENAGIKRNNTTLAIAERIRCEARYSVAKATMDLLASDLLKLQEKNNKSRFEEFFLNKIENPSGQMSFDLLIRHFYKKGVGFRPEVLKLQQNERGKQLDGILTLGDELKLIEQFAKSEVGFNLQFTITEDNGASAGALNFKFARHNGTKNLGLGGNYTLKRKNQRVFSFAEVVEELVLDKRLDSPNSHCNELEFDQNVKSNFHLPIYGKIGLDESFLTYAGLNLSGSFGNSGTSIAPNKVFQNITDTITFTTTTSGSVTPSIVLSNFASASHITNASVKLAGGRINQHQLILIIQPGTKDLQGLINRLDTERFIDSGRVPIEF
ncbi:MAG: hypothetical protein AAF478_00505 [Pseudomonadota bacterium]